MMRIQTSLLLGLLAGLAAVSASGAPRLESCHVDGVREALRCGHVQVLESDGGERVLDLRVVILPATRPNPLPDPLVVLAGGPGQAASALTPMFRAAFGDVHESRDIVLIDQRGTGESNALDCPLTESSSALSEQTLSDLRSCVETLEDHADLSAYSTYHAADDLERVRQAFGWPLINLWGGSYGSRLALVYQDRYPERVRSMVLDGVAPYSLRLPLPNAASAQRAFDQLVADCAADAACRASFPDPAADLDAILGSQDASSQTASSQTAVQPLEVEHPLTGEKIDVHWNRASISGAVRAILYETRRASLLPYLLRRAAAGDFEPLFATSLEVTGQALETMHLGLTYTVLCSEDLPRIDPAEVTDATAGTFAGRSEYDSTRHVCETWPTTDLPARFDSLGRQETPALLLSGALDPVTPPAWGEEALELLPNGRHEVVSGVAHITSFSGCAPRLIAEFLDAGSADELETECLGSLRRPPFVLGPAGPALDSSAGGPTATEGRK